MNIKIVNKNGVTLRTEGKYCSEDINVTIDPSLLGSQFTTEEKTFTPTTSVQTYTPTSGVYVSKVTVNAMPTGKAATPATTITAAPTISVSSSGLITASASATKSVTPTITSGYVSSGTSGTITVSGSNTKQLTTKAATTYTPTTTNQTIAASTYLTGVQTIKGDANLVAGNIKSGVSIFGVSGTYTGSTSGGGEDEDVPSGPGLPSNPGDLPASVTFLVRIFEPGGGDLIYVNASGVKTTAT